MRGQTAVEKLSNGGQTAVEQWSNCRRKWSNGGQYNWSNGGQAAVEKWSNGGQTAVGVAAAAFSEPCAGRRAPLVPARSLC